MEKQSKFIYIKNKLNNKYSFIRIITRMRAYHQAAACISSAQSAVYHQTVRNVLYTAEA